MTDIRDSGGASRPKAVVSWSSGKDSAYALQAIREEGRLEAVGILTTLTEKFGRVSMHGVRESVLDRQAEATGLPIYKVRLPFPCPNTTYEKLMAEMLERLRGEGVRHVVFGDLFLEDIRAYRVAKMQGTGLTPEFPLWGRPTNDLAREMIGSGLRAMLVCVDPRKLDRRFAGRWYDSELLAELPREVDPCGENGEFHTCVCAGPMFSAPLQVVPGAVVERDGLVFADLLPQ